MTKRTPGVSPITSGISADVPALSPKISVGQEGGVRQAVERRLASFGEVDEARVALALTLAQALDDGAGLAVAAVSRELRATLSELEQGKDVDGEIRGFLAGLRSPTVGNGTIG